MYETGFKKLTKQYEPRPGMLRIQIYDANFGFWLGVDLFERKRCCFESGKSMLYFMDA